MSGGRDNRVPAMVRSIYPPLLLIVLSIVMIVWSYGFNETARTVPLLVGYGLLFLSGIDFYCRLDLPFANLLSDFWGADFRNPEMSHNPDWKAEAAQILWITGCVAAMLLIGILPTAPLFVMSYMAVNGSRRWPECLAGGAAVFGFVYVVFELLLDYQLYRGVLFDERGFANW